MFLPPRRLWRRPCYRPRRSRPRGGGGVEAPGDRRGYYATFTAIVLPFILGLGALAVDHYWQENCRLELQNAVDASAHAGAQGLDGTSAGLETAGALAADFGGRNVVAGYPLQMVPGLGVDTCTVNLGRWEDGAFVEGTSDPMLVTAVQVKYRRRGLPTFFARWAFGIDALAVEEEAVALAGGVGIVGCALPLAIPSCALTAGGDVCDVSIALNADTNDSGAWAGAGSSRPSAQSVRDAITSCVPADVSQPVSLTNGAVGSASQALAAAVSSSSATWDVEAWGPEPSQSPRSGVTHYGRVLTGLIYVFDDPSDCKSTVYNGTKLDVVGFAQVNVYDVVTSGPVGSRQIKIRSSCDTVDGTGGGGYFGVKVPPTIVQ